MVKKPFWNFNDAWPWVLVAGLFLGGWLKAFLYGLAHHVDKTGLIVVGIIAGAAVGLVVLRFVLRYLGINKWNNAFQTRLGCAVISEAGSVPYRDIDSVCDETAFFWKDWAVSKNYNSTIVQQQITDALAGATIIIYPQLIERGNPWWHGKFVGLQEGQVISVTYDKQVVKDEPALLNLIKHELSHLCLSSIGVLAGNYGDLHHQIFAETKFC